MPKYKYAPKLCVWLCFALLVCAGCGKDKERALDSGIEHSKSTSSDGASEITFEVISPSKSGITFRNQLDEFRSDINYFNYFQMYQGAGVATGDLNNDGLPDIVFQSCYEGASLYQNKGELRFEKIDLPDQLFNLKAVGTGISLIDINKDGLLDIYLCYSGPFTLAAQRKSNKLLINKGDFTFVESAEKYGLDNRENSSHSTFFDYDKDGDLDMYLVNTNPHRDFSYKMKLNKESLSSFGPQVKSLAAQDRLFENRGNGNYIDVTRSSGLLPEAFFGFNATIGDFNNDTWPDVFVTNDFYTPDFLYINQQDGTFKESCTEYFRHTSFNSMGSDVGDINNDGFEDVIAVDMSPPDYKRSRRNMLMTRASDFNFNLDNGYGVQYMHNVLQLNSGLNRFSEISQFAGIDKTDWSWAVLSEDFDNDGFKDLYVTNGIGRDINDIDAHNKRTRLIESKRGQISLEEFKQIVEEIPSIPTPNFLFRNQRDLTFKNVTKDANIDMPSFSHGVSSVDLDNDGDLDLVVNNQNEPAFLLENTSPRKNFIQFNCKGPKDNEFGIGTKICVSSELGRQCHTLYVSRGYMSSTDYRFHFGLGADASVEQVEVFWSDGNYEQIESPEINSLLTVDYRNAGKGLPKNRELETLVLRSPENPFQAHVENEYDDYADQILLPHKLSQLGPCLVKGDVNGDGLEDVFIGGGANQTAGVYLQSSLGKFNPKKQSVFATDQKFEDTDAVLFDFDLDDDLDLFVTSGSYELKDDSPLLEDRLYLNDGKGNFSKYDYGFKLLSNSESVSFADIDGDNDLDLFVGGRCKKAMYPYIPTSYLLLNNEGKFEIGTTEFAPALEKVGMVTDAEFIDLDNDNDQDLVVVGEWMPISVFENKDGHFTVNESNLISSTEGWWNCIEAVDIDDNGQMDLVIGNLGLNYKFQASAKKPLEVYCQDFDSNGTFDIVLAKPLDNGLVPVRGKMCSTEQMPFLEQKFPSFDSYANAQLKDIYGEKLDESLQLKATKFESCVLLNEGNFQFEIKDLPTVAQLSPVKAIEKTDINRDGKIDLIVAGNMLESEIETTRGDAGLGAILLGDGQGNFEAQTPLSTGFMADKNVRDLELIDSKKGKYLLVVNNNEESELFLIKN